MTRLFAQNSLSFPVYLLRKYVHYMLHGLTTGKENANFRLFENVQYTKCDKISQFVCFQILGTEMIQCVVSRMLLSKKTNFS